jgi:hypothetical protein
VKFVLDDEKLHGSEPARITFRPHRTAEPVRIGDMAHFRGVVERLCQVWGGANSPLIPTSSSGFIDSNYSRVLAGSAIDGISGLQRDAMYHSSDARVSFPKERDEYRTQLAMALFKFRKQKKYPPLSIPELDGSDPWRDIYAATLGLLPTEPDKKILQQGNLIPELRFEDFLRIQRPKITGSLQDLLERLDADKSLTPRITTMIHLGSGGGWSTGIRTSDQPIPRPGFARSDAGPNVVVVCSPNSVEDLSLLWNLRAAAGDHHILPIGLPLGEFDSSDLDLLATHRGISRHGMGEHAVYVTSASLKISDLRSTFEQSTNGSIGFASITELLHFGNPAGWMRDEVLVWTDGHASVVPLAPDSHRKVFENRTLGRLVDFRVDVHVMSNPFPMGDDVRSDAFGPTFFAGSANYGVGSRTSDAMQIWWPSRIVMARAVASCRGLELRESEPGRAGRVALTSLADLWELDFLAHAPLLEFLEEMAAHTGISFYKRRQQQRGQHIEPTEVIARTIDDLPEKSMHDFKRVLGNNQDAAKSWLLWAERRGLVVKGFPLQCEKCGSKQWIPVAAFNPPIICRGCAASMDTPFGDRPTADFKYRLSERMRRVYEHDAMGHLMAIRYFRSIFGGSLGSELIGLHPGIEIRKHDSLNAAGEADVLMLLQGGELIPMEVKHSFNGMTDDEVDKLDRLSKLLGAPWSALVVSKYGKESTSEFIGREHRMVDGNPFRVILTYDLLLSKHPMWSLGGDPFKWAPLSQSEIDSREKDFVTNLAANPPRDGSDWKESQLVRPRRPLEDSL